jgi:glucose/mannose transport system substrate-binding protein
VLVTRPAAAAAVTAALALAGVACGGGRGGGGGGQAQAPTQTSAPASGTAGAAGPDARPVEMFSWWERIGDSDALGALIREQQRRYPADVIINASAGLSGLARKTLRTRMLRNEPPDTFQANVGYDLMQWVLMNGMDARETRLLPLDDLVVGADTWRRVMPAAVLAQVTYDGRLYGVPSNIHRINSVFYNKHVFRRFGLTEPTSIDDLRAIGRKLAGTGVAPIAVGSREPWTLALLMFECLLVAREGPATYRDYFRGAMRPDDPRVIATLEAGMDLFAYVNPDHAKLSWLQAMDLVIRDQAAMTVMGDWARVSFNAQGWKPGEDYGEIAFPGSAGAYVFTSDAFSLPVDAKNKEGARRLLETIGSADGQRVINAAKGSLAARLDVPPQSDPVMQEKFALLRKGTLVLALSGSVPRIFSEDLAAALAEMLAMHDTEPVVHMLRSRYALLKP